MNPLTLITDGYERKARLYPALMVLLPVIVAVVVILPGNVSAFQSLVGLVAGCGGAFLLSQLARDAGKKGEKMLFERWGGLPSVAIFRHRDSRLDTITKARYHKKLVTLVKGSKAPSAAEENANPTAADQTYTAWSTYLRVHTRDVKKFSLLFQENVNYRYRRNLWGMRRVGIVSTALATAALGYRIYQSAGGEILIGAIALTVVLLLLWIFRFTAEWVRVPADAYAERLAETVETVGGKLAPVAK
jgi:hypothetical protein